MGRPLIGGGEHVYKRKRFNHQELRRITRILHDPTELPYTVGIMVLQYAEVTHSEHEPYYKAGPQRLGQPSAGLAWVPQKGLWASIQVPSP